MAHLGLGLFLALLVFLLSSPGCFRATHRHFPFHMHGSVSQFILSFWHWSARASCHMSCLFASHVDRDGSPLCWFPQRKTIPKTSRQLSLKLTIKIWNWISDTPSLILTLNNATHRSQCVPNSFKWNKLCYRDCVVRYFFSRIFIKDESTDLLLHTLKPLFK
jgi:ABC-type microcin C transport system permease subunit YejB